MQTTGWIVLFLAVFSVAEAFHSAMPRIPRIPRILGPISCSKTRLLMTHGHMDSSLTARAGAGKCCFCSHFAFY